MLRCKRVSRLVIVVLMSCTLVAWILFSFVRTTQIQSINYNQQITMTYNNTNDMIDKWNRIIESIGVRMPSHLRNIQTQAQAQTNLFKDLENFKHQKHTQIPKIIHQIYKNPKIIHQIYKNTSIPDAYAPYIRSWIKHNPDFKYYFWDDTSGPKFIRKYYKEFAPLYEAYCHVLMRSDALRYFILHKYGGVYMDADYECYKPIHERLNQSQCHVVQENWPQGKLLYQTDLLVSNSFMASTPGHPFMKFVINSLPSAAPIDHCHVWRVLTATGPMLLNNSRQIYEKHCDYEACKVNVLPWTAMMMEPDMYKGNPIAYLNSCGYSSSRLSAGGQKACRYLKEHIHGPGEPGPEIYATHKFLHIGYNANKYKARSYSNISKLVPNVIFPDV